jgi:hypothetical protein
MVIIFIRRFIRLDKEELFLQGYKDQTPFDNPAFRGETLTKVNSSAELPPRLRSMELAGPDCATYLNIAMWDSWEAFADHFLKNPDDLDGEIETAPRERAVLNPVDEADRN